MRRKIVISLALALCAGLFLAPTAQAGGDDWLTSWDEAAKKSEESGKPILIDFTGSDWCGWCIKLKNEVFSKEAFKTWAKENVVLLELDYPRKKEQTAKMKGQNAKLASKYGIRGYPTILFLDATGKQIGKSGYRKGGPEAWTTHANTQIGKK